MVDFRKVIEDYATKYEKGFTCDEQRDLCTKLDVDVDEYYEKLGINTCMVIDGDIITYHCDVEMAIGACLEKREQNPYEWD